MEEDEWEEDALPDDADDGVEVFTDEDVAATWEDVEETADEDTELPADCEICRPVLSMV